MGMLGLKPGTWWLSSEEDPRWNATGHVDVLSVLVMPEEAEQALAKLKKEFGTPPADLEYGCMKD